MTIISTMSLISVLSRLAYYTFILPLVVIIFLKLLQHQPSTVLLTSLLLSICRMIAERSGYFTNTPASRETDCSSIKPCVSLLRNWLEQCDAHHDDRCTIIPIAERPSWQIPDWVIDSKEGCLVPGHSVDRYAALSYVWDLPSQQGSQRPSDRLMLRIDNLDSFQRPGFLSAGEMKGVPVVVRDSLDLILQAGIRYLWVDCLCIVQHAETTRSRVEAMKEIYSGACVTVVAATDKGGLFVPRTCNEDGEEAGGETSQQTRPAYPINAQGLHGSLLATHWASRGWTFQEQLLSKRSINFLDDTIFWDCECSVWWPGSEGIAGDAEEKFGAKRTANPSWDRLCTFQRSEILVSRSEEVKREVEKHETLSRALKSPSVPNFRLYMELICRYNHRSLTYPQDALPAFSGVLRSVTQGSLNSFVCGLPAIFLDAALLWQPLQKAKRRVATGTSRNIAPAAPLPSWSWVGWQCLIDPESMINGLDYEVDQVHNGISVIPQTSWKTTKLVDWYALSNKDHSPGTLLIEHQLMNSCKEFRNNPYAGRLPEGWSRKSVFEFVSTRALVTWQGPELSQSPEYQPIQCFFHGNQDDVLYYYPFPSIDTSSMAASSLSDAAFLSCITSVAHFNIRRILVCEYTGPALIGSLKSIDYSVTRTPIYKDKAELMKYNSVITLEDSQGRWAGLLKVMDDNTAVDSGHTIQLIAISKGRADRREVSRTYEARVDKHGCILNGFRVAHFQSSSNDRSSSENERNKNLNPSPDLGPLNPKDLAHDKYSEWEDEMYSFYNVLWVETKDGVMYRKAAGRISEDIWEQTCSVPQRIVLG